jgi:hypothetical protein
MNANAIIGFIVAIVVIGGGAWYFTSQHSVGKSGDALEQQADTMEESKGMGTFADLMKRAGSWKCTVKTNIEEAPSEGVAYIADGKIRADFTSKVKALGGKEVKNAMIQTEGFMYTWSDMMPQGIKMAIPESSVEAEQTSVAGMAYSADVDYDCALWMMDASMFVPPSDITFMEIGANGMPQGMPMPN